MDPRWVREMVSCGTGVRVWKLGGGACVQYLVEDMLDGMCERVLRFYNGKMMRDGSRGRKAMVMSTRQGHLVDRGSS